MMLWVGVTVAAAMTQTVRFMIQKQLKSSGLSTGGAAFSRFLFGAPLALMLSAISLHVMDQRLPDMRAGFWAYVLAGGVAQIIATHLTVAILALRNFAVGVAFTKTETVQVALFSAVILGETVGIGGWAAILIGLAGVLCLTRRGEQGQWLSRSTVYGVVAGGLFALSAVCYRGAALELGEGPAFLRAIVTLACVTSFQTLAMGAWMRLFEAGELTRVVQSWRRTIWVGVTGMLGSLFWFYAFALQNAAYVRALGQVELLFTLLISYFVFRERLTWREGAGMMLLSISILAIIAML
jgi:drug/metabolite transporter (DMT)-like permease